MKPIFCIDKRDDRGVAEEVTFYEMSNGDIFIDASDVVTAEFSCHFTIKNKDLFNLAIMFKQICDKHYDKRRHSQDEA